MKIALLGAESTGKTQLAQQLAAHLRGLGKSAVVVPEVLREWCDREGRTPRPEEQDGIAREQARRVDSATADWVIADTTPLMVAVYSDMLFHDSSLYAFALAHQRSYAVTLVTGLDIAWVADGLQRDGPHVREPVDALVRGALARGGIAYRVVYGRDGERLSQALAAIDLLAAEVQAERAAGDWRCEHCGDSGCEHRLFTRLMR